MNERIPDDDLERSKHVGLFVNLCRKYVAKSNTIKNVGGNDILNIERHICISVDLLHNLV